jgi:3-hydroxybutyryl-CoA dehydrogenase
MTMEVVGIVGAGTMGAGIAEVAARSGARVNLYDVEQAAIDRGITTVRQSLARAVERNKVGADEAQAALERIRPVLDLSRLAECDVVVEAVPERADLKQRVFQTLGAACSETALLASNTSSLSITEISSGVPNPERVVGLHFFNPVPVMQLVEVVRGQVTSDDAVERATRVAQQLGKRAVLARDTPGFIVNRVARPFYLEGLRLVGDGFADVAAVDTAMRGQGFRMGPFELMDLIGIDVNLAVSASIFEQSFGEQRFRPHVLQASLVRAGQYGRKTGRGYYDYASGTPRPTGIGAASADPPPGRWSEWASEPRDGFIIGRILSTLVNEGFWAVGQRVASREDVDLGMRLGTNWPRGPFEWADQCGIELICASLDALRDAFGDAYVCAPLLRSARR